MFPVVIILTVMMMLMLLWFTFWGIKMPTFKMKVFVFSKTAGLSVSIAGEYVEK